MAGTLARRGEAGLETVDLELYPALVDGVGNLAQVMEENVGRRMQLSDLTRITVPTGGGQSFEITDELTHETDNVKYIEGVLVHWQRSRVWWPPTEGDELSHEPPHCSSVDGRVPVPGGAFADGGTHSNRNIPIRIAGHEQPVRACRDCPMNQFGSHPKEGRKGKACKEQILLFVLRPGDTLPVIIVVPPTSKVVVENFMVKLSTRYSAHHSGFQLRFGLVKVEKGNTYSQIVPTLVGVLDGITRGGDPDPNTPAGVARLYSREFAGLLTTEDLIEAATGGGRSTEDGDPSTNGHRHSDILDDGDLPPDLDGNPSGLGGDFADHEAEPALS